MNPTREQLVRCFTAVFPELSPEDAPSATVDTLAAWDSSHHFVLMHVIEETFAVRIPQEVAGEVVSFRDFENYLAQEVSSS